MASWVALEYLQVVDASVRCRLVLIAEHVVSVGDDSADSFPEELNDKGGSQVQGEDLVVLSTVPANVLGGLRGNGEEEASHVCHRTLIQSLLACLGLNVLKAEGVGGTQVCHQ